VTATDPQVARWARREQLLVLLSRMQRGVLLPAERGLLRAAVETELAAAEDAHAEAERLRKQLTRVRLARRRLNSALIASAHLLDVPFSNRPDQSPWSWSVKPALSALGRALAADETAAALPAPDTQETHRA
jgi:hypothetical protein